MFLVGFFIDMAVPVFCVFWIGYMIYLIGKGFKETFHV